jgi:hypothetical protein
MHLICFQHLLIHVIDPGIKHFLLLVVQFSQDFVVLLLNKVQLLLRTLFKALVDVLDFQLGVFKLRFFQFFFFCLDFFVNLLEILLGFFFFYSCFFIKLKDTF